MVLTRLNEQQCRKMFLGETMHYPAFLDKLKGDVYTSVSARIISMLNDGRMTDKFCVKLDSDYVDAIDVSVILFPSEDIFDEHLYAASYLNSDGELDNGKLRKPKLSVKAPINDGLTDLGTVKYMLSHELTHLYDDWNSIRNGYGAICNNENNVYATEFLERYISKEDGDLTRSLAFLAYISLKTEKQAFASQTVEELAKLGCEQWNYKEKIKETSFYKNVVLSYNDIVDAIEKIDDMSLVILDRKISSVKLRPKIPRLKSDIEAYRVGLLKWAERRYLDALSVYGGVVQYYLDMLKKEEFKKYGPPLHFY